MAYTCPVNGCSGKYVGWRGLIDSPIMIRQCSENPAHFYFIDEVAESLSEIISKREQRISTMVDQMRSQLSEEYPEAKFEMCFLDGKELLSLYIKQHVISNAKTEVEIIANTGAIIGKIGEKTVRSTDTYRITTVPDPEEVRLLNKYFITDLIIRLEAKRKH